jgi:hypothetical protein
VCACVRQVRGDQEVEIERETFGTFADDLERLREWLKRHQVHRVAMESTGVYWVPVWNVLETEPDAPTIHKARSLSWLAQFVCQIATNLKWEDAFKTEGIENVADFRSLIKEANDIDPSFCRGATSSRRSNNPRKRRYRRLWALQTLRN